MDCSTEILTFKLPTGGFHQVATTPSSTKIKYETKIVSPVSTNYHILSEALSHMEIFAAENYRRLNLVLLPIATYDMFLTNLLRLLRAGYSVKEESGIITYQGQGGPYKITRVEFLKDEMWGFAAQR